MVRLTVPVLTRAVVLDSPSSRKPSLTALGTPCRQGPEPFGALCPQHHLHWVGPRAGFGEGSVELLLTHSPLRQVGLGGRNGVQYLVLVGGQPGFQAHLAQSPVLPPNG